jgi:hypothetical protein
VQHPSFENDVRVVRKSSGILLRLQEVANAEPRRCDLFSELRRDRAGIFDLVPLDDAQLVLEFLEHLDQYAHYLLISRIGKGEEQMWFGELWEDDGVPNPAEITDGVTCALGLYMVQVTEIYQDDLYLAIPRDEYVRESVRDGGTQWVDRFNELYQRLPLRELGKSKELPRWLQSKPDYTVWQRNNLWMLYNAMALGSRYVTLIALWDGEAGDGPGGTKDMVNKAEESAAKTIILPTSDIFAL